MSGRLLPLWLSPSRESVGLLHRILYLPPGSAAGVAVAEVVRLIVRKRRSMKLFKLVRIAVVVGALPLFLIGLLNAIVTLGEGTFTL